MAQERTSATAAHCIFAPQPPQLFIRVGCTHNDWVSRVRYQAPLGARRLNPMLDGVTNSSKPLFADLVQMLLIGLNAFFETLLNQKTLDGLRMDRRNIKGHAETGDQARALLQIERIVEGRRIENFLNGFCAVEVGCVANPLDFSPFVMVDRIFHLWSKSI